MTDKSARAQRRLSSLREFGAANVEEVAGTGKRTRADWTACAAVILIQLKQQLFEVFRFETGAD
jgi:hypothetical protein